MVRVLGNRNSPSCPAGGGFTATDILQRNLAVVSGSKNCTDPKILGHPLLSEYPRDIVPKKDMDKASFLKKL